MQAIEIKSRPILFSGEMVRAILDGRKTQTRRIMKPRYLPSIDDAAPVEGALWQVWMHGSVHPGGLAARSIEMLHCPYGAPGDRLWVRESWAHERQFDHLAPADFPDTARDQSRVLYGGSVVRGWHKTRPSIHMPRWASRILLEVTDVRVERVQDISPSDCAAEGVCIPPMQTRKGETYAEAIGRLESRPQSIKAKEWAGGFDSGHCQLLRVYFSELWDSINAKRGYGWESNPWVWAVAFKVIKGGNTDA